MGHPIDAVSAAVLKVQVAQRAVETVIQELVDRVSVDPFGDSSLPVLRLRLSKLRGRVDQELDALIDALDRMGEAPRPPES